MTAASNCGKREEGTDASSGAGRVDQNADRRTITTASAGAATSAALRAVCDCGAAEPDRSSIAPGVCAIARPSDGSGTLSGCVCASCPTSETIVCDDTTNLYPTPGTVTIRRGTFGTGSILRRKREISTSTLRS